MLTGFCTPLNVRQKATCRLLAMRQRVINPLGTDAKGPCSEYEMDRVPFAAALCARSDQQILDFASHRCRIPTRDHSSLVLFSKCYQHRRGFWFFQKQ